MSNSHLLITSWQMASVFIFQPEILSEPRGSSKRLSTKSFIGPHSIASASQIKKKKPVLVIFRKCSTAHPSSPPLTLQNLQISGRISTKFFGLIFDSESIWISHIKILREKCINSLSILKLHKLLSHPALAAIENSSVKLYNSLIRSQLDYGAQIYIASPIILSRSYWIKFKLQLSD